MNLRQSTVELLRKYQASVAQDVVASQVAKLSLTPAQQQTCLRDANYNIQHLADAIELDSILVFEGYISWLRDVLSSCQIPKERLAIHLRLLKKAYALLGDIEQQQVINIFVDQGLLALEGEAQPSRSFLLDCGRHSLLAQKYIQAVLASQRDKAVRLVMDALASEEIVIKDLYVNVLTNVLYEVGRLWQERKISVAQEHYASAVTQYVITLAYDRIFVPSLKTRRVLGVCIGDELHEMGIRMVCDIFELSGYDSHYLGANVPTASIISEVERVKPQIVALSATLISRIGLLKDTVQELKAIYPELIVIVGGSAFSFDPDLWRQTGADGCGRDALHAVELADGLVVKHGCS